MEPLHASDIATLRRLPRFELGRWPTPIERVGRIWVKRDDLSGYGRGGAKTRKIEHVLGHVLARGHDELITVAGNVTNLAFDLLPALDRAGVRARLFIADDPPAPPEAREEIFAGVRDRIELIGASRVEAAARALAAYRAGRRAGRRPFLLLPGASHPAAVVGNACGFLEMARQFEDAGRTPPSTVFITAATGNTIAGFLAAERALRREGHPSIRVVGVQVYPGRVRRWTWAMLRWTRRFAGLHARVPCREIEIDDSELLGGFGRFTSDLADECDRVRSAEGLSLDPIFGGKTWHAMQRYRREARVEGDVLYWHCGFTPEWRTLGTKLRARVA